MILSLTDITEAPVGTRNFPGASRVTGKKNSFLLPIQMKLNKKLSWHFSHYREEELNAEEQDVLEGEKCLL
jgi:hypothetical protein